jgi:hypothetical protein
MAWKYGHKTIKLGKAWVDNNGIQHPANWGVWSDEEKAAKGLVWEADPTPYDNRFYWGRNADDSLIPKALDDVLNIDSETSVTVTDENGFPVYTIGLKTQFKRQTNITANSLLQPTDWMVVANTERGRAINASVTDYRAAVVSCATQIKTVIDACTSIDNIVALWETPTTVSNGITKAEGKQPINNWPNVLNKV